MMEQSASMAMRAALAVARDPRAPVMPRNVDLKAANRSTLEWIRLRLEEEGSARVSLETPLAPMHSVRVDAIAEFEDDSSLAVEMGVVKETRAIRMAFDRIDGMLQPRPSSMMAFMMVVFAPASLIQEITRHAERFSLYQDFVLVLVPLKESGGSTERMRGTTSGEIAENSQQNYQNKKNKPEAQNDPEPSTPENNSEAENEEADTAASPASDVRPEVLSDDAIETAAEDQLGFERYAQAIYALIDGERTKTPLTIAIHAPWGSGKTSLARLIEEQARFPSFSGTEPHKVFWFNAWLHDEGNSVSASFVSALARYCDQQRPLIARFFRPISADVLSVHERRHRRYLYTFSSFVFALTILFTFGNDFLVLLPNALLGDLKGLERTTAFTKGGLFVALAAAIPFAYSSLTKLFTEIGAAMGAFVLDPKLEAQTASLQKVRRELSNLVRKAVPPGSRIIIIVDDLERCRPPGCIDLLEAMNQLFDQQNLPVVFLVLADMEALSAAATVKYEALSKHYTPAGGGKGLASAKHYFGQQYLEKLIALQFDIPHVQHEQLLEWTTKLNNPSPPSRIIEDRELPTLEWAIHCARDPDFNLMRFAIQSYARPFTSIFSAKHSILRRLESVLSWKAFSAIFLTYNVALWRLTGTFQSHKPRLITTFIASLRNYWLRVSIIGLAVSSLLAAVPWLMNIGFGRRLFTPIEIALPPIVFIFTFLLVMLLEIAIIKIRSASTNAPASIKGIQEAVRTFDDIEKRLNKNVEAHRNRRKLEERSQDKGAAFGAARDIALKFVRSRPRSMKRMINRLRLAVYLTRDQKIDPQCIGKWTALQENWPELASYIAGQEQPSRILDSLEEASDENLIKAVGDLVPGLNVGDRLKNFIRSDPKLKNHIDELVKLSAS